MELTVRGRLIRAHDIDLIRTLLEEEGERGRCHVARELCQRWNWVYEDGRPKARACQDVLTRLETQGVLALPRRRGGSTNARRKWRRSKDAQLSFVSAGPATAKAPSSFVWGTIDWRLAMSGREDILYKELVHSHHYLGYRPGIGHSLRYIAFMKDRPIACVGWSAAAWKLAARDQWIGWSDEVRQRNLQRVVNNTRYLVLDPVPHLASHALASNVRRLARDWQNLYGYSPLLLETFVDTTRFKGTCYKAANWICVGMTQGRGKYDRHTRYPETVKAVFVYALTPTAREELRRGSTSSPQDG